MVPARYVFAVLGSIGFAIIYGLKVNLSVAIVAMVNHTALAQSGSRHAGAVYHAVDSPAAAAAAPACAPDPDKPPERLEDGPFEWSETTQGYILASYFWGYLVTQLPGGRMAELLSAKWVMLAAVLVNAVCTLLTPPAAALHAGALLAMRVGEGLGAGLTFPAMHVMISKWAPPDERSVLSSIIYAGTALGTVVSMLLSGVLADVLGWASVFYVMGGLSLVWCALWCALVADSPAQLRGISESERDYIEQALGHAPGLGGQCARREDPPPVPWKSVWTSGPFWAILIAHFCSNFGWYMLLIELPTYMRHILQFSIKENAGLSALPFLLMWLFSIILGRFCEWTKKENYLSVSSSRKISTLLASLIPAICLVGVSFVGCNRPLVVMLMSVAVMSVGGMFSGFISNHIDIAPNYAGTLMAITNTFATIPGFVVPVFVGQLTDGNQTMSAWRKVFLTAVGLYICEAAIYVLLGSGEEQKWNKKKSEEQLEEDKMIDN
ncbi:Sialin [Frankliniella fusca]|uniref:Sialin n=1 Tax=Frankliniella fusca TaxID=407009 RepID=A0AAE1GZ99_9NEOP|nr:Sialin [Frankliniella fusca]